MPYNPIMQSFTVECWYRYRGSNEKDFVHVVVDAENEEEALETAKATSKRIYKTDIVK